MQTPEHPIYDGAGYNQAFVFLLLHETINYSCIFALSTISTIRV
jgi:hypothetical protein